MNRNDEEKFEQFKSSLSVFLEFPDVETRITAQAKSLAQNMLLDEAHISTQSQLDALTSYVLSGTSTDERLKLVLGLTCSSVERLKRICLCMFPNDSWATIKSNENYLREICALMLKPDRGESFIPKFIRDCLRIPDDWQEILSNEGKLVNIAMRSLQAKYAVEIGSALENRVRQIVRMSGFESEKGKVELVNDKEVDVAIPSLEQPQFLIMSSYSLTTSSSQSSRANEQSNMYQNVQNNNRFALHRGRPPVRLINVLDGGGWIDRPNDLKKIWINSDFCLTHAQLDILPDILRANYMYTD